MAYQYVGGMTIKTDRTNEQVAKVLVGFICFRKNVCTLSDGVVREAERFAYRELSDDDKAEILSHIQALVNK